LLKPTGLVDNNDNNGTTGNTDTDEIVITDQYIGHFIKVSYIVELDSRSVYSKDRIDVSPNGVFRFFLPNKLLMDNSVKITVFAPDGEQLGEQIYSVGSLFEEPISVNCPDDSSPIEILVNPKIIEFNQSTTDGVSVRKVSGKLIDISGYKKAGGAQIVIIATDDPNASAESDNFKAIFEAFTDANGYFFGKIDNKTHEKAYCLVAGLDDAPISIQLDNENKIPNELFLVGDLSSLPDEQPCRIDTPALPDSVDLVRSQSFSQDIEGKCVDFTIPNRTLEEFSFYHTVRTTEPEIKGLTITTKETKNIKNELFGISEELFFVFKRLNNSMKTLSMVTYTVDEEIPDENTINSMTMGPENVIQKTKSIYPVYQLKVSSETVPLKLNTQHLMQDKKDLDFNSLLKVLAVQANRKAKLQELHVKLTAAYCGKHGLQEAKSYCDSLIFKDTLNRDTLNSLLGHIYKYSSFVAPNAKLSKNFKEFLDDMKTMLEQPFVGSELIKLMKKRTKKVIQDVDIITNESQDQEELLGYMRRLISELSQAEEMGTYNFEPCSPTKQTETMGIICIMQQFEETKETLLNKTLFSLNEILSISVNYEVYLTSIASFLDLLEQFYSYYSNSQNFSISLEDDYFITHYNEIKSSLIYLKRQINVANNKIKEIENAYITNHPGRKELTVENSVDWDETPTIYENTTIAHGHILHFKQKWKADGYSLGDLLYSLPLAPCQEKQIAIIDWDREDQAARSEAQDFSESLVANVSRNRDISEIMNASFKESISARSQNETSSDSWGVGGAIGGFYKGIFGGVAGGYSHSGASSESTASQKSSRNLSGNTLNQLQDKIFQSASALRSQRSTVIQTVGQNETMTVQTEVVKNNNHCHAVTIEYFEVLKHYAIEQELVDVQECLFVPLPMSLFDHAKILRWRNTLRKAVYGQKLQRGFDAIERIENNYADSDLPVGSYADEIIEEFRGYFSISFELKRPYISEIEEETKTEIFALKNSFPWFFGFLKFKLERPLTESEKDTIFDEDYAPDIVRTFVDTIDIYGIDDVGNEIKLDLDLTLLSNYRRGVPLKISIASRSVSNITRRQIKHLRFRANTNVKAESKIILRSVYMYYRTKHLNEVIIRNGRVNNDIINTIQIQVYFPTIETITKTDSALMYTPLSGKELRDPRKEDREAAEALVSYLNEHMELAHKFIWSNMDNSRLFGLLDGYIAPNSGGKSVSSVVENKIMGIVGNNLVMKVVPGKRLDPVFRKSDNDLLSYYQPTIKPDPFRISVPTKGVYAESIMGKCNSCEEIDETKHWRFTEVPCGTQPTPIDQVSTASRKTEHENLQVKDLPPSIISMQNVPAAPDPTGLSAAFNLLGKNDVFKDMTGLAGTQANAIEALKTTSKSVTDLASMAADLQKQTAMKKDIGKTLKAIQEAEENKQISAGQANKLSYSALSSMVGRPTAKPPNLTQEKEVRNLIKSQSKEPSSNIKINRGSESVEISPQTNESKQTSNSDKLNILGSPAPGTNPGSSKTQANAVVDNFKSRSGDLKFNVTRTAVASNLTDLINDPNKVNQGKLNLCGPAATIRSILRRDPKLIAECVVQLLETGKGTFGRRTIEPDNDLRNQTYQSSWGCGAAEWVLMSSMRDDKNWWFDYEGTPDEDLSAATTPGEIKDWFDETGIYSSVEDEANIVITEDIAHALGLSVNNRTDNILLIHSHLLRTASATNKKSDEFILSSFPNHWVVLNSQVIHASGRVKLEVWSWGEIYSIDVPEATFEANYYGAVFAKT
jgi:hypothetical protein